MGRRGDGENGRLELRFFTIFEIVGRMGWKAKYLKIVDQDEITLSFWQEIYDDKGLLVEIHEKYPIDKGHKKIEKP